MRSDVVQLTGGGEHAYMKGVVFRWATPADAMSIVALVNTAYCGDSSRAGWNALPSKGEDKAA
ncbi:MAG: hypothetical protein KKA63_01765 [Gammaproteobacteria bacterium]|nr:hypothetical protein [Gammaproteobacteria bacterium]